MVDKKLGFSATPSLTSNSVSQVLQGVLRNGNLSRIELSRETGLAPSSITAIVQKLIKAGLLEETDKQSSTGGRRATSLKISEDAGYVLGVAFDREATTIALSNFLGDIKTQKTYPTFLSSAKLMVDSLSQNIAAFLDEQKISKASLKAIGISTQGMVDIESGSVVSPVSFHWDHPIPLRQILQDSLEVPVAIDQDAHLSAMAEFHFGAGQGYNNLIYINVGMGIGAGILINGQVYRGANNGAGEFGHTSIDVNGDPCLCGNVGCIENTASIPAMTMNYKKALLDMTNQSAVRLSSNDFLKALLDNDPIAQDVLSSAMRYLARGVVNLANLFDPERIVIGGPLQVLGEAAFQPIVEVLENSCLLTKFDGSKLVLSKLNDRIQTLGAVALVVDKLFSFELPGLDIE